MKEIELTRGLVALVDDEDYEYLNQWNWQALTERKTCYAKRWVTRTESNSKRKVLMMHRAILEMHGIDLSDKYIDHINGHGLDNRKSNLRVATKIQNGHNRRKYVGSSRYKGVWAEKGKWRVAIQINGKLKNLGTYESEEEAAARYNGAAIKYFGEFAQLNSGVGCLDTPEACQRRFDAKRGNKTSIYKGVHFEKGKWRVSIRLDGKTKYCGRYASENEAAQIYNQIMERHFGNNFRRNMIHEGPDV